MHAALTMATRGTMFGASMSSESEPVEGTRVAGRYVIERELGRGGTKRVYLARDALTGVRVAVALLASEFARDAVVSARFSREARAASALRSPFTVRVFDVGKLEDNTRYLVLEAVLGRGLDQAMEDGAIDPERAARWTLEVLAALYEAHSRGVIHRDVKPENIMLAPTDAGELAKLTDFGLAKVVDAKLDASVHLHTAANAVLGTPDYMAPEQWKGGAIDPRTDLYAVGVLLFEMLCGSAPFAAKELPAVYAGHLFDAPPAFGRSMPAMALALEPVVRKALSKRQEDRYESALAMAQAIAAVTGIRVPEEAFCAGDSQVGRDDAAGRAGGRRARRDGHGALVCARGARPRRGGPRARSLRARRRRGGARAHGVSRARGDRVARRARVDQRPRLDHGDHRERSRDHERAGRAGAVFGARARAVCALSLRARRVREGSAPRLGAARSLGSCGRGARGADAARR
jgi:tRNA A-37 threonylcarbamoyl transferase component Bud32